MQDSFVTQKKVLWLTLEGEAEVVENNQDGDGSDGAGGDQPYLKVNDRTVYKTAEDAIKGFNEAQTTITSLSGYRQVLKELGAPENADPAYLKGVLTEYLRLAAAEDAAKKSGAAKKPTASEADKEFEGQDPQVVAQTKRGREWLKANAGAVGLISKEEYDKLKQDFEEFKGGFSQKEKLEHEAVVSEGQQKVTGWLSDAKVSLESGEREKLESLIVAYVNADQATLNRWLNGDRATKMEVIKEGYSLFLPIVKPGSTPFAKAASTAAAGKTKIGLVNRTKTLPQNGGSEGTDRGKEKTSPRVGSFELREKALAMMRKMEAEQSGAGD